jgi:hypothetical protein
MRLRIGIVLVLTAVAAGCGGTKHAAKQVSTTPQPGTVTSAPTPAPAPHFRATLEAPTHTPPVGAKKWWYVVRASNAQGKPLHARLTVQVVDPLGTAHAAEVGTSTRKLLNFPFTGRYRDFTQWPAASRGYRLTFRVIVKSQGSSRTLTYWVRPR